MTNKFSKRDGVVLNENSEHQKIKEKYEKYLKSVEEGGAEIIDESWKKRPDQSREDFAKEIKEKVGKSYETDEYKQEIYKIVDKLDEGELEKMNKDLDKSL